MRPTHILLTVAFSVVCAATVQSAEEFHDKVQEGIVAWQKDGAEAGYKGWLKGGPMEGANTSDLNDLQKVQALYGDVVGYSVVKTYALTEQSRLVFLTLNFDKGLIFGRFLFYKTSKGGWVVVALNYATVPEEIWPRDVVYQEHQ